MESCQYFRSDLQMKCFECLKTIQFNISNALNVPISFRNRSPFVVGLQSGLLNTLHIGQREGNARSIARKLRRFSFFNGCLHYRWMLDKGMVCDIVSADATTKSVAGQSIPLLPFYCTDIYSMLLIALEYLSTR